MPQLPGKPNQSLAVLYACVPVTSKPPFESTLTVPEDVVPSPQSIVAVKLPADALTLESVNVATTPENCWPAVAASTAPWALSEAEVEPAATVALLRPVPTTLPP